MELEIANEKAGLEKVLFDSGQVRDDGTGNPALKANGEMGTSKNLQPQLAGRKIVFENRRILDVFEDRRKQFDALDDED